MKKFLGILVAGLLLNTGCADSPASKKEGPLVGLWRGTHRLSISPKATRADSIILLINDQGVYWQNGGRAAFQPATVNIFTDSSIAFTIILYEDPRIKSPCTGEFFGKRVADTIRGNWSMAFGKALVGSGDWKVIR